MKPPPHRQSYDVAILGAQLGGAVAGALLARRGYRVLAVEHDGTEGQYTDGPWQLPHAPNLVPSLRQLPAANAVLEELGLATDLARALLPLQPGLQILAPEARLDLFAPGPKRTAELTREFGAEGRRFAEAMDALAANEEANGPLFNGSLPLPAEGLAERFRLRRALGLRSLKLTDPQPLLTPQNHPLARGLKELWRLSNSLVEEESLPEPNVVENPARAALRPLGHLLRGLFTLPGGLAGLAASLRRRIEGSGGTVLVGDSSVIEELTLEHRRVAALRLVNSPHQYRARVFVAATETAMLRELLPTARVKSLLEGVRTRSQLLSLNLVVAPEALPPGLGPAAVCLPTNATRAIFLQVSPAVHAQGAANGAQVLNLSMQVPSPSLGMGEEGLRKMLGELRQGAEEFLPFLERHILLESAPLLVKDRSALQAKLHPRFEIARPRQLGITGLPLRSPISNLLLANQEVLPGLGLEGEFLGGLRAAALVQALVRKADPLQKR